MAGFIHLWPEAGEESFHLRPHVKHHENRMMTKKKIEKLAKHLQLIFIAPPALHKPIFLIGTVRSGTSLLAQLLGEHPDIRYLGFELSVEWCKFAGIQIACPDTGHRHCPPLHAADATQERIEWVREGFAKRLFTEGGSANHFLLNKNPHLWNKLPFLHAIFPDARLIVVGRDIRSTVASTKRLWETIEKRYGIKHVLPDHAEACWDCIRSSSGMDNHAARTFPNGEVSVLADYWLRVYQTIETTCAPFDSVIFCRHRDLVEAPDATLNTICSKLDLPLSTFPSLARLDATRNHRWREILTDREQDVLETYIDANTQSIQSLRYADTAL